MENLLIYLLIGLLLAATLILHEGGGWRESILRLAAVTVLWLPGLGIYWFFFVVFSPGLAQASKEEAGTEDKIENGF